MKMVKAFAGALVALSGIVSAAQGDLRLAQAAPGAYVDILSVGQRFDLVDDDEVTVVTTVGNALLPAGAIKISNNGTVSWTNVGGTAFTNDTIPSTTLAHGRQALAVYWDDLYTFNANEGVYVAEIDGTLYITWRLGHITTGGTGTVQLQVFSGGPIYAQFVYKDVDYGHLSNNAGSSATIGYQAGGVGSDVLYAVNQGGSVVNGTVLSLFDPQALRVTIVDNIAGRYLETSSMGDFRRLPDDGDVELITSVGNVLLPPGAIRISNNGAVGWNTQNEITYHNENLPSSELAAQAQALAVYWDDLLSYFREPNQVQQGVSVLEQAGVLYVTWRVGNYHVTNSQGLIQLQVFSSGPVFAQFIYVNVNWGDPEFDNGASATIGYQAGGAAPSVQWSSDQYGRVTSGNVLSLILADPTSDCGRDFNHDGEVNADDLGDFITAYFSGCP